MTSSYFSVVDLACARNNQLLFSSIHFSLNPGEIKHIRGENGIGKTTLLRCLAGLSRPHSGEVTWCGNNVLDNECYQEQLLFLGHKNTIKSTLTLHENLIFSPSSQTRPSNSNIQSALKKVGLESKQGALAVTLSAGQKQRLALSKLLLSTAKLWILDEPFTALDHDGFHLTQELMRDHLKQEGIIIFSSHQLLTINIENYSSLQLVSSADESIRGL